MSKIAALLVKQAAELEGQLEYLEGLVKDKQKELRKLLEETIPGIFDEMEVSAQTFMVEGKKIEVEIKPFINASISEANRDAAHAWISTRNNGSDSSIVKKNLSLFTDDQEKIKKVEKFLKLLEAEYELKEAVHPQTLKKYVRELTEEGVTVDSSITVYSGRKANIKIAKE